MSPARYVKGPSGFIQLDAPRFITPRTLGVERASSVDPTIMSVSIAPSATAHTKGAWVELVASTPADVDLMTLTWNGTGASSGVGLALADIGIGASGSETVLVENVPVGSIVTGSRHASHDIPIHIPSGSRISLRWQSGRNSALNALFGVHLKQIPGVTMPSTVDTIGANTATSGGIPLTSTVDTWTEITSSTSQAYQGIVLGLMSNRTNMLIGPLAVNLGIGASGSETTFMSDRYYQQQSIEEFRVDYPTGSTYMAIDIPAGARIAVKHLPIAGTGYSGYHSVLLGIPA